MYRIVLAVMLVASLSGCCRIPGEGMIEDRVHHVVFCWLKDPGNEAHRQNIVDTSRSFRSIPGVVQVRAGRVVPSDRKIVDDTFDVGCGIEVFKEFDINGEKIDAHLLKIFNMLDHEFGALRENFISFIIKNRSR